MDCNLSKDKRETDIVELIRKMVSDDSTLKPTSDNILSEMEKFVFSVKLNSLDSKELTTIIRVYLRKMNGTNDKTIFESTVKVLRKLVDFDNMKYVSLSLVIRTVVQLLANENLDDQLRSMGFQLFIKSFSKILHFMSSSGMQREDIFHFVIDLIAIGKNTTLLLHSMTLLETIFLEFCAIENEKLINRFLCVSLPFIEFIVRDENQNESYFKVFLNSFMRNEIFCIQLIDVLIWEKRILSISHLNLIDIVLFSHRSLLLNNQIICLLAALIDTAIQASVPFCTLTCNKTLAVFGKILEISKKYYNSTETNRKIVQKMVYEKLIEKMLYYDNTATISIMMAFVAQLPKLDLEFAKRLIESTAEPFFKVVESKNFGHFRFYLSSLLSMMEKLNELHPTVMCLMFDCLRNPLSQKVDFETKKHIWKSIVPIYGLMSTTDQEFLLQIYDLNFEPYFENFDSEQRAKFVLDLHRIKADGVLLFLDVVEKRLRTNFDRTIGVYVGLARININNFSCTNALNTIMHSTMTAYELIPLLERLSKHLIFTSKILVHFVSSVLQSLDQYNIGCYYVKTISQLLINIIKSSNKFYLLQMLPDLLSKVHGVVLSIILDALKTESKVFLKVYLDKKLDLFERQLDGYEQFPVFSDYSCEFFFVRQFSLALVRSKNETILKQIVDRFIDIKHKRRFVHLSIALFATAVFTETTHIVDCMLKTILENFEYCSFVFGKHFCRVYEFLHEHHKTEKGDIIKKNMIRNILLKLTIEALKEQRKSAGKHTRMLAQFVSQLPIDLISDNFKEIIPQMKQMFYSLDKKNYTVASSLLNIIYAQVNNNFKSSYVDIVLDICDVVLILFKNTELSYLALNISGLIGIKMINDQSRVQYISRIISLTHVPFLYNQTELFSTVNVVYSNWAIVPCPKNN